MNSNGEKLACESCIRGHRVTKCQHTDRPLLRVSRKGRPVSQCNHCRTLRNSRSVHTKCKCASASHQAMLKEFGKERCCCDEGAICTCAHKSDRRSSKGVHSPMSADKSSTPSSALSPPESEHATAEITPTPLHSCCAQSSTPSHDLTHTIDPVSTPSLGNLNDWHSTDILDPWNPSLEGHLPDPLLQGPQDLTGTWDSAPDIGTNEQAWMTMPTFDDPLLTLDSPGLGGLLNDSDISQIPMFDNWDIGDFTTSEPHDQEQRLNQLLPEIGEGIGRASHMLLEDSMRG